MDNKANVECLSPPLSHLNSKPDADRVPNQQDRIDTPKRSVINRHGFGSHGQRIPLLANYFKVTVNFPDAVFFQYTVSITTEDGRSIASKVVGRKLLDRVYDTYSSELADKRFAYDGEKTLYTVGPLPQNNLEFTVVLEKTCTEHAIHGENLTTSSKRTKHSLCSRIFKVAISYATKVPLKSVVLAHKEVEADNAYDALRVLDIILRQQSANRGCLLVGQSFFHDDSRNFTDIGGGVAGVRGYHSSFRATHGGLSLNMDVSMTLILTPGPVIEFLKANQNVNDLRRIDWGKAKRMLKNLRVRPRHRNMEFKIIGLSEKNCNQQYFPMKVKNGSGELEDMEVSVFDYFTKHLGIQLSYSAYLPCIDVGKPKRPNYLPVEICSLVSLQHYKKALSPMQRASLVEKSRQKPLDRINTVTNALKSYNYDEDPLFSTCGLTIDKQLVQLEGRVLEAPKLKVGNSEDCIPHNGRWNFNNKTIQNPTQIDAWAIVNFSARCDTSLISRELINCGRRKGIHIERPHTLIEEDPQSRNGNALTRVERMVEKMKDKLPGPPQLILCVLPEKKNSDIYGPWKKKCLCELGIVTQCISPSKINDQYLTNVLLKINSKLGGINSLLALEHSRNMPLIMDTPTMILGMDVSHGSPGQTDMPSVAAVVGSRCWPLISRYRASVRAQSPKVEMIDALFKPLENDRDDGIIRELLLDFYESSNQHKPRQIIVFRDGVSESQFNQVLNIELDQIIKAYQYLGEVDVPKFTVIVAQKNHHTKLFRVNSPENVPPGTVVDKNIVHPRNYDFYLCSHAGLMGTSRPAHYHVLLDEIGFSSDNLQNLIHSLSYVNQRSTAATSIVAPICYAHLAARQMSQFLKFNELSETSSVEGSMTSAGSPPIPELPRLDEAVEGSMFFC